MEVHESEEVLVTCKYFRMTGFGSNDPTSNEAISLCWSTLPKFGDGCVSAEPFPSSCTDPKKQLNVTIKIQPRQVAGSTPLSHA